MGLSRDNMDKTQEFWLKYIKADMLKRRSIIKKLIKQPIFDVIFDTKQKMEIRKYCLSSLLYSYFDDLINAIKVEQEKEFIKKFKAKSTLNKKDALKLGKKLNINLAKRRLSK